MKIVFMGTPDFASVALEKLYSEGFEIAAVFTQPDRPKNRGMKLSMSPVKELALQHGTPVYQPENMKDGTAFKILEDIQPELIIAVAYGNLLPEQILNLPKYGCINIHGSILPKYRGSAPIQWTVLNGDETAGVTSMFLNKGMDTGDIIFTRETPVGNDETSGQLFDRLAVLGGELLCDTVRAIENGTAPRTPQNEALASYAPPLTKEQSVIDFSDSCKNILNKIRGLNPWPVAKAEIGGTQFKVFAAFGKIGSFGLPGTIVSSGKDGIEVACGDGSVTITQLQAPGGRRMAAGDYLRGHPIC